MTVDIRKLESIAFAIREQASLLRRAGRIFEATGMEQRADELLRLARPPEFGLCAA